MFPLSGAPDIVLDVQHQVVGDRLPEEPVQVLATLGALRAPKAGPELPAWAAVPVFCLRDLDDHRAVIRVLAEHRCDPTALPVRWGRGSCAAPRDQGSSATLDSGVHARPVAEALFRRAPYRAG